MNEAMIEKMTADEIERAYHLFDKPSLEFAVKRLLLIIEKLDD